MRFVRPVVVREAATTDFGALALLLVGLAPLVVVEGNPAFGATFVLDGCSVSLLVTAERFDLSA